MHPTRFFSFTQAIKEGFNAYLDNFSKLIIPIILGIVIVPYSTTSILGLVLYSIYGALMVSFCLRIYNNQVQRVSDFLKFDYTLLNYLLFMIWYLIIVTIGFLLLIFPGAIWLTRYIFAAYFILEYNQPIEKSMTASSHLVWGSKVKIFLVLMALGIGTIIWALLFKSMPIIASLGGVVIQPLSNFILISIYKQLLSQTDDDFKRRFISTNLIETNGLT